MKPKLFLDEKLRVYKAKFKELQEPGKRAPRFTLCTEDFMLNKPTKRGPVARSKEEKANLSNDLYYAMLEKKRAEKEKIKAQPKPKTEAEERTVSMAIELYRNRILDNPELGKSPNTKRSFETHFTYWESEFGSLTLDKLTPKVIMESWTKLAEPCEGGSRKSSKDKLSTRSNSTLNRYLASLRAALGQAKKKLWIKTNPASTEFLEPEPEPHHRETPLTLEQKEALLKECKGDLHDAVSLSILTSAREMEVWHMKWAWINFDQTEKLPNGWVTFPKHVTKNSKERSVPLGKASRSILLERHLKKRNMWVFPSSRKEGSPNNFRKAFENARANAIWINEDGEQVKGLIDFHYHDLRHTAGSFLARAGVHPKAMQKIMGHSDIGMTMKYAHFAKEDLANAMLLLEDELGMTVTECHKNATNNTPTLN
mgnify:CR=1 FL=1